MRARLYRHRSPYAAVLLLFFVAACASADVPGYRFDVPAQPVAVSAHSEFNLRLTDSAGEPVGNATITQAALEMTHVRPPTKSTWQQPSKVPMITEVKYVGSPGSGLYRFVGDVSMPGTWRLAVTATVPGTAQPVSGTALFTASD